MGAAEGKAVAVEVGSGAAEAEASAEAVAAGCSRKPKCPVNDRCLQ